MYTLKLTKPEVNALAWLTDRGYFPAEIYDNMRTMGIQPKSNLEIFHIPEHFAWSLIELRDNDPDAYLTCLGEPLLTKILELEESIV